MFEVELQRLLNADAALIMDKEFRDKINYQVNSLLSKNSYTPEEYNIIGEILHIGNIIYNNTDLDDWNQVVDNDAYDILLERYRVFNPNVQVGAEPVHFPAINKGTGEYQDVIPFIIRTELPDDDNFLYKDTLYKNKVDDLIPVPFITYGGKITGKKYRIVGHGNDTLVGTLDKVKCVLDSQAIEKGCYDDPSYKILERDFFATHMKMGIINMNTIFSMMLELKYDGMSVVVTIKNRRVIMAVSRGDTGMDKATDLTPVLEGYYFPNLPANFELDVKCEAVMTYADLYRYNIEKGNGYVNCRSAIIGLFSSNDGAKYQEYITLVPLAVAHSSVNPDKGVELDTLTRDVEVEFINTFLVTKEYLRATMITGDFNSIMFQIKKFVDEAELIRPLMPTMYDGIVVSYVDPKIREILGRENFVNKYSVAVKFNTLKKLTRLLAITYTVGQDGTITPMAHYQPVTFLGSVHTKSSISSVNRFNKNKFKIGNVIEVEYRNDVMPYVSTPDVDENIDNPNPVLEFITECPICGSQLQLSKSGKSMKCINLDCRGRAIARMANMMDKIGLKDFAEASMEKINKFHLTELIDMNVDELINILGEVNAAKFVTRMRELKTNDIYDYIIIGALGFSSIAQETWKKILFVYNISEILGMWRQGILEPALSSIKGIGPTTIDTIVNEMEYFEKDVQYICNMTNIKSSKNMTSKKSIRVTGFRNPELMSMLVDLGYDASDKGVTKTTDILLVPHKGFSSSKLSKIGPNTKVVPIQDFMSNMEFYLNM